MIDSPDAMSRVGAFFDVDRTIVSCNTGRLFLRDLRRQSVWFRLHEDIIHRTVNLGVFIFIVTTVAIAV